jgi:hypothetical protein
MKFLKKPNKKPQTSKRHLKRKVILGGTAFTLIVLFFMLFGYLIAEYIDTHTFTFRSPIQSPVIIKRVEIISPISSPSAMLNTAYAEEVKNPFEPKSPKGIAWQMVLDKWGIGEWGYFEELIFRESGWNPYAINQSSGACGLGQALPCSKLGVELWDYEGQLNWIVEYINTRYDTPAKAIEFHNSNNWY